MVTDSNFTESGPGSNGVVGVLHSLWISRTRSSPSDAG